MRRTALFRQRYARRGVTLLASLVAVVTCNLLMIPVALAGGGGGAAVSGAIQPAQDILDELAQALTGGTGIVIGTLAMVFVGIYIMFARSTGQAVGAVAKVIIGLVILFGGVVMVTSIQGTGAVL